MESGVVVGYEQTPPGERALAEAAAEAARRGVGLTVVHAVHHAPPDEAPAGEASGPAAAEDAAQAGQDRQDRQDRQAGQGGQARQAGQGGQARQVGQDTPDRDAGHSTAHDVAEEGAERVRASHPGLSVRARTVAGHPEIVLTDESSDADLLVIGHHGHGGFSGLRPGSVALRTVARAACPAMVVRGPEHQTRGTVLAAVDAGDGAEELLDFAFAEAASRGARLKAVSALEGFWSRVFAGEAGELGRSSSQAARAEEELEALLEPWPEQYPDVVTDHELIEGSPTTYLTGATTYADLIVVGVRRRTDGRHNTRVGPVAETLLLHADCPVVVVPHA